MVAAWASACSKALRWVVDDLIYIEYFRIVLDSIKLIQVAVGKRNNQAVCITAIGEFRLGNDVHLFFFEELHDRRLVRYGVGGCAVRIVQWQTI